MSNASAIAPRNPRLDDEPLPTQAIERWVRIDASGRTDEVDPTTPVGGVAMVCRLVRLAARADYRGAIIEGGDPEAIMAALARWPAPEGFPVEQVSAYTITKVERELVDLDGCAVYAADELPAAQRAGRAPQPISRISTHHGARAATADLIHRTRKSVDDDGLVAYYLLRPLSRAMSRALVGTRIAPNAVTVTALLFGIAAAICAAFGGAAMVALAGGLYWVGAVIDCVDGELARVRLQGTKIGEWLDSLADDLSTYGLLTGLGIGMVRDGYPVAWAWTAAIAGAVGFLLNFKLCLDLARWGLTIDTARYPWFFGTPASGDARKAGWSRIIYFANFLVRRDAVVTMVAIVLSLGLRPAAVIGFLVGIAMFTAMFFVHGVVVSIRRKPDEPSFWSVGYLGVKDLFTIINLMGGVGGIYFALEGRLDWAGYAIFVGYLLGDVLDGPVARWTGTSNRFGSEFDAAADHVAQAVAPSIIVYVAFTMGGHQTLGVVLLGVLLTTASIRQARFAVATFHYPLTYCGLPRTVSGLIAISLPNSVLFFKHGALGYSGAAVILILIAAMNLSPIPYMGHKGRKIQPYVKVFVASFLLVPPLMMLFAPEFVFDVLFVITFGYALGAWIPLRPHERREYWVEYKRWSNEVAARK